MLSSREIEIIIEALKSVDDDFKRNHREIYWAKAKGMRNLLAHEYFRVNMQANYLLLFS